MQLKFRLSFLNPCDVYDVVRTRSEQCPCNSSSTMQTSRIQRSFIILHNSTLSSHFDKYAAQPLTHTPGSDKMLSRDNATKAFALRKFLHRQR